AAPPGKIPPRGEPAADPAPLEEAVGILRGDGKPERELIEEGSIGDAPHPRDRGQPRAGGVGPPRRCGGDLSKPGLAQEREVHGPAERAEALVRADVARGPL